MIRLITLLFFLFNSIDSKTAELYDIADFSTSESIISAYRSKFLVTYSGNTSLRPAVSFLKSISTYIENMSKECNFKLVRAACKASRSILMGKVFPIDYNKMATDQEIDVYDDLIIKNALFIQPTFEDLEKDYNSQNTFPQNSKEQKHLGTIFARQSLALEITSAIFRKSKEKNHSCKTYFNKEFFNGDHNIREIAEILKSSINLYNFYDTYLKQEKFIEIFDKIIISKNDDNTSKTGKKSQNFDNSFLDYSSLFKGASDLLQNSFWNQSSFLSPENNPFLHSSSNFMSNTSRQYTEREKKIIYGSNINSSYAYHSSYGTNQPTASSENFTIIIDNENYNLEEVMKALDISEADLQLTGNDWTDRITIGTKISARKMLKMNELLMQENLKRAQVKHKKY